VIFCKQQFILVTKQLMQIAFCFYKKIFTYLIIDLHCVRYLGMVIGWFKAIEKKK